MGGASIREGAVQGYKNRSRKEIGRFYSCQWEPLIGGASGQFYTDRWSLPSYMCSNQAEWKCKQWCGPQWHIIITYVKATVRVNSRLWGGTFDMYRRGTILFFLASGQFHPVLDIPVCICPCNMRGPILLFQRVANFTLVNSTLHVGIQFSMTNPVYTFFLMCLEVGYYQFYSYWQFDSY